MAAAFKRKVLLVNPGWEGLVSGKGRRFNRAWPPLDLLNCAALLEREEIQITLIDARAVPASRETIRAAAAAHDLTFVTSSPIDRWQCPNLNLEPLLAVTAQIEPSRLFVMGAHGTVAPEAVLTMTGARGVIRGEPESTVLALGRGIEPDDVPGVTVKAGDRIVSNPDGPPVDLSTLPMPAFHLLDLRRYRYELLGDRFALLETTRGCHYRCSFCLLAMYGKGYRRKGPDQVLREVTHLTRSLGARCGYFIDLEFTADREYVLHLCDRLAQAEPPFHWACQTRADCVDPTLLARMKRAGCRLIHFGVESGSARVLAATNKRITPERIAQGVEAAKRAGIDQACFFLFGFPGETLEEMDATIAFAKRLNPTYASFHVVSPYPGTPLYTINGSSELFPEVFNREHDPAVLRGVADRAFREFYLRPGPLWSRVRRMDLDQWRRQAALFWNFVRPGSHHHA